jgi:hypothetical protein
LWKIVGKHKYLTTRVTSENNTLRLWLENDMRSSIGLRYFLQGMITCQGLTQMK